MSPSDRGIRIAGVSWAVSWALRARRPWFGNSACLMNKGPALVRRQFLGRFLLNRRRRVNLQVRARERGSMR